MQTSGKKVYFQLPERSLSYAKIMQTSGKKVHFQLPECSLSYAKIVKISVEAKFVQSFCYRSDMFYYHWFLGFSIAFPISVAHCRPCVAAFFHFTSFTGPMPAAQSVMFCSVVTAMLCMASRVKKAW